MCFKYEEQYPAGCWDYLEWGEGDRQEGNLCKFMEDYYGVAILGSPQKFVAEFMNLCESLHERGIIGPKAQKR